MGNGSITACDEDIPITISTSFPVKLVFTRMPPIFFLSPSAAPVTAYKSLGHFSRTFSPSFPRTVSPRHASTTASAKRYCTNTSFDAGSVFKDVRRSSENWRHPEGDSHTLAPRPRPVSCCEANDRNGVGSRDIKRGFLDIR